jgi:hypothetical protein
MIFYQTDNSLSQDVGRALSGNHTIKHIQQFDTEPMQQAIFYGLLRGCSRAMHIMKHRAIDYWYIDNGYIGAKYIDERNIKEMNGTFRLVKNDMIEPYNGKVTKDKKQAGYRALLMPPSVFTANFYDMLPEEWINVVFKILSARGYQVFKRDKQSHIPLDDDLRDCDLVVNCNSMAAMRAVELGIPVYDTHWIFRNVMDLLDEDFIPTSYATWDDVKAYYEPKQYTLEQMRGWNAQV